MLDVMIAIQGRTRFVAGNRAEIVRNINDEEAVISVHIGDVVNDGGSDAHVAIESDDIAIIFHAGF